MSRISIPSSGVSAMISSIACTGASLVLANSRYIASWREGKVLPGAGLRHVRGLLPALQTVVGRVLVRLAQRRHVERRFDEVVDRVAVLHDGLPDVNRLRRAFAEDVAADQLPIALVEDELQQPFGRSTDVRARAR